MTKPKHIYQALPLLFVLFLTFGCGQPTPVFVYITPTPQNTATAEAVSAPTEAVTASQTLTSTSTSTPTPTESETPRPETVTPLVTFMGPVVGPDYTLQPTETPRPTRTPSPTFGPSPTSSFTPTPPGPSPTPLPLLDRSRIGIQIDPNLDTVGWAEMMYHAEQLGVGWVKIQANWQFLQPNSPTDFGQEFGVFQLNIQHAKSRGFKVLVSVAKAPAWARSNDDQSGPPDDPRLLGNFISFMLSKDLAGYIDAIEVWNEPNLEREWTGILPFSGGGYMQLFNAAYGAVRGHSQTIIVVTAGLAPTQGPGTRDDREYLREMYNAGLGRYTDIAVGIHPYSWGNPPDVRCCDAVQGQSWDDNPRFFFSHTVEDYRNIMVENGHSAVQLWSTEFGWATWEGLPGQFPAGDGWMVYNDKWEQANYTIRAIQIAQGLDYMGPMFLWNLNFANEFSITQRIEMAAYSILIPNTLPVERPLYCMLSQVTGARSCIVTP